MQPAETDDVLSLASAVLGIRHLPPTMRAVNSLRWIILITVSPGKFSNLAACCRVTNDGIESVRFSIEQCEHVNREQG
jgi:hypothetical protein